MQSYITYNLTTGAISSKISGPDSQFAAETSNEGFIEDTIGIDIEKYYVDLNTVTLLERQKLNLSINKTSINSDGIDKIIISNIPVGSQVRILTDNLTINDSIFEFTSDIKGKFRILIDKFPFLQEEVIVNAI
jgi:hypothetical protein